MNTVALNISGIANNQMKTSLKNALDKIEGVSVVEIDKKRGTVKVGFGDPADETQIRDSITESGFYLS